MTDRNEKVYLDRSLRIPSNIRRTKDMGPALRRKLDQIIENNEKNYSTPEGEKIRDKYHLDN